MMATYSQSAATSFPVGFHNTGLVALPSIASWTTNAQATGTVPAISGGFNVRSTSLQQYALLKLVGHIVFGATTVGVLGQHSETFAPAYDLAPVQNVQRSSDVMRRFLRDVHIASPEALMRIVDLTTARFPKASISYRVEADADMDSSSLLLMDIDTVGMPIDEQMDLELNLHRAINNDPAMRGAKRHILINVF